MSAFRFALIRIRRRPGAVMAGIVILATAQGVLASAVSLADRALLRPFDYPNSEQLYRVLHVNRSSVGVLALMPAETFQKVSEQGRFSAAAFHVTVANLELPEPRALLAADMSPGTMAVFQVAPLLGEEFGPDDAKTGDAVMLSESLWREAFGSDPNVVGRQTKVNGIQMRIAGVTPPGFSLPLGSLRPQLYLVEPAADAGQSAGELHSVNVVQRLTTPQATMETLAVWKAVVADVGNRLLDRSTTFDIRLAPLATLIRSTETVRLFAVAGAAILVLALIVVAYLLSARHRTQLVDFEIQRWLGASKSQLLLPLAIESAVIAVSAGLLGLTAARWAITELSGEFQNAFAMSFPPALGTPAIVLVVLSAGLAALLFLALPASHLRQSEQERHLLPQLGLRIRLLGERTLITAELAVAASLVIIGVHSSLKFIDLTRSELGFEPQGVLAANVGLGRSKAADAAIVFDTIAAALSHMPGVTAVATADYVPFIGLPGGPVRLEGHDEIQRLRIRRVSPEYFTVLNIAVLDGRGWTADDMLSPPVVCLVSSGLVARFWPDSTAIGRQIQIPGEIPLTVVGVVADTRDLSVGRPPEPTLYIPFSDRSHSSFVSHSFLIKTATGEQARIKRAIESTLQSYRASGEVSQVIDLSTRADVSLRVPRLYASAGALFGWVAVLLAFGGSFAVLSEVAARSRRDLAVRIALGATRTQLVRHFGFYGGIPIVIGIVLGALVGLGLTSYLGLLGQQPLLLEAACFMAGVALLLVCGFVAVMVPAYRAARTEAALVLNGG